MIPRLITAPLGLVLGTLYPAYASYKAVRTKNVREYVKWMMYWIVFAFFTSFETVADIFIAFWFPFYYEIKLIFLLWLISPVSRGSLGSSMLYRRLVHPNLMRREEEIDRMINHFQDQGYNAVVRISTSALQYVTNFVLQTALRAPGFVANLAVIANLQQIGQDQVDFGGGGPVRMAVQTSGGAGAVPVVRVENQALQQNFAAAPQARPDSSVNEEREDYAMDTGEEAYESFEQGEETSLGREIEDVIGTQEEPRPSTSAAAATKKTAGAGSSSDDDDVEFLQPKAAATKGKKTAVKKAAKGSSSKKKKKSNLTEFSSDDDGGGRGGSVTRRGRAAKTKASVAIAEASLLQQNDDGNAASGSSSSRKKQ